MRTSFSKLKNNNNFFFFCQNKRNFPIVIILRCLRVYSLRVVNVYSTIYKPVIYKKA